MIRFLVGVLLGFGVWVGLWIGGNHLLFPEFVEQLKRGDNLTDETQLAKVLALSVGCSVLAGLTTAFIARPQKWVAVIVLSLLLIGTGLYFQSMHWKQMPDWFHYASLGLILPVCLGASLLVKGAPKKS
jgi:predicted transporter